MTGPVARDPLPGEPEWRDRWQGALCAVCGHSRGTHESLPADHRFVPRPNGDPGRPGLVPLRKLIADTARALHGTDDGTEWAPLTAELDDDAAELIAGAVLTWMDNRTAPMADALRLIAGDECTNFTGDYRCWQMGKTRGARYGADAWCEACIAQDALNTPTVPSVPPQPTVPRAPVEALLAAWGKWIADNNEPLLPVAEAVAEVRRHLNGDT